MRDGHRESWRCGCDPWCWRPLSLLLVAVLITGWVSGLRPALVAWVLATLAFAYYFTPPFDSLKIEIAETRVW